MAGLREHLEDLLDRIEAEHERVPTGRLWFPTGFRGVDRATGGVGRGGWLIVGGPGAGTTAVLLRTVRRLALGRNRPVVRLLTAELSEHEVLLRLVAAAGSISVDALRTGELAPGDWKRLAVATRELARARIELVDARGWSQGELELWCADERPHDGGPASWLAIDGLDRLHHPGLVSLRRLERLAGRNVLATLRGEHADAASAAIVTHLVVDELGHRRLLLRSESPPDPSEVSVPISVHVAYLDARESDGPQPGAGQLRLTGM